MEDNRRETHKEYGLLIEEIQGLRQEIQNLKEEKEKMENPSHSFLRRFWPLFVFVLLVGIWLRISTLQGDVQNVTLSMQRDFSRTQDDISQLGYRIEALLKDQGSMVAEKNCVIGEKMKDTGTVDIQVKVLLKEVSDKAKVTLLFVQGQSTQSITGVLEADGYFHVNTEVSVSDELEIILSVLENGIEKREVLENFDLSTKFSKQMDLVVGTSTWGPVGAAQNGAVPCELNLYFVLSEQEDISSFETLDVLLTDPSTGQAEVFATLVSPETGVNKELIANGESSENPAPEGFHFKLKGELFMEQGKEYVFSIRGENQTGFLYTGDVLSARLRGTSVSIVEFLQGPIFGKFIGKEVVE